MIIAGLAFKASAAPFHMWTPDVYQGAPTAVTGFMSAATKAVALVATVRILVTAFPEQDEIWTAAVAAIAIASLAIGNFAALVQHDVKRLLAYSSISQAGFLLIAVAANTSEATSALLYFLVPYGAASVGAFAVIALRERELGRTSRSTTSPGSGGSARYGVAMWTFVLSFAGLPFTGGFLGKFYVFAAAFDAGWWPLVLVGVVATAVSLYYYLGIVKAMYMRPSPAAGPAVLVAGGLPPRDAALGSASQAPSR